MQILYRFNRGKAEGRRRERGGEGRGEKKGEQRRQEKGGEG